MKMEINFKYNLKDLVSTRSLITELEARALDKSGPIPFFSLMQIVTRRADECSAGVQCSYVVSVNGRQLSYHEDELVPGKDIIDRWLELAVSRKPKSGADHERET